MDSFSAILCVNILPGIGQKVANSKGFKDWITSGSYVPKSFDDGSLLLERVNVDQFAQVVSFDYERFALASLESYFVASSERREYGAASWPLLKLYYSSFFAAHAILRSRGAAVVNLDRKQTCHLSDLLAIYGHHGFDLSSGTYMVSAEHQSGIDGGDLSIRLRSAPSGKGVHESFWLLFSEYLTDEANTSIQFGKADSREFLLYAENLRGALIDGHGSSSWLSSVRNKINYSQDYDAWMPYRRTSEAKAIASLLSKPAPYASHLNVSKKRKPLEAFMNISCYMANMNLFIGNFVADRSNIGGGFGQRWRRLKSMINAK